MHIIGAPYDVNDVDEPLTKMWNESMKVEKEATTAPEDMIKAPEPFKKETKWHQ
jgi:hypothetical protein